MMDTMKNSQLLAVRQDAELLRQQEAFINQNRLHIEKRRRSREYLPDRERSSSPPSRRRASSKDRDSRKPYNAYRGGPNRARRASSRENNRQFEAKRRRSGSYDNDSANKTDEKVNKALTRIKINPLI